MTSGPDPDEEPPEQPWEFQSMWEPEEEKDEKWEWLWEGPEWRLFKDEDEE